MSFFKELSLNNLLGVEGSEGKRDDYLRNREGTAESYIGQADKFDTMADDFFDPSSGLNTQRFGILNSAIQDQTASGIRDWQATMAQQGQNTSASGVGAQNILQARRRAGGDSANAMNKAYLDSFGLGMNAAKMGTTQRQLGDNIYAGANQVKMQQDSINSQKRAGLMQQVVGAGMNMLAPGMGSMLGGMMAGEGNMMQNFKQPYADKFKNNQAIQNSFQGLLNYATGGYKEPSASGINRYDNQGGLTGTPTPSMRMPNFNMNKNFANVFNQMGTQQQEDEELNNYLMQRYRLEN